MKNKCMILLCAVMLASCFGGCGKALQKEDFTAQALSAYRAILKAAPAVSSEELQDASLGYEENIERYGNHYDLFAVSDLNQDGIPELIALTQINFRWTPVSVFTYADGQAVRLSDPLDPGAHGTFEQCSTANGAYTTYLCEGNHIHSKWTGTTPMGDAAEEDQAYTLSGTTLTAVQCTVGETEKTVYFHDIAKGNTKENMDAIG